MIPLLLRRASDAVTSTAVSALDGGRPFATGSPWNTPLTGDETWSDETVLRTLDAAEGGGTRYGYLSRGNFGIYFAAADDPVWRFDLEGPDDASANRSRTTPLTRYARAPAAMQDGSADTPGDSDHILVVVSDVYEDFALTTPTGENCVEMWGAECFTGGSPPYAEHRAGYTGYALFDITADPGAGTLVYNDGVRAANFSWAAGCLTAHDFAADEIEHALVVSLTQYTLDGVGSAPYDEGVDYVSPATMMDNGGAIGPILMGSRFGIPPGTSKPTGLSPQGEKLWTCLSVYGAFVGDYVGGTWPIVYVDGNTVSDTDLNYYGGPAEPDSSYDYLFTWWYTNHPETGDGVADLVKLWPLLQRVDPS